MALYGANTWFEIKVRAHCLDGAPGRPTPFAYFCHEDEFRPLPSQAAPDKVCLRFFAENLILSQAGNRPVGKDFPPKRS